MSKILKVGLGLGVVAGLVYYLTGYARQVASQFGFSINSFGIPGISGGNLVLPIVLQFNNPAPVAINADNVKVEVFIPKNGQWIKAATVNQPMPLPTGTSQQRVNVEIDLRSVFGGNIFDTITSVLNAYNSKTLPIHADVYVTYQGITLPPQSFDQNVVLA